MAGIIKFQASKKLNAVLFASICIFSVDVLLLCLKLFFIILFDQDPSNIKIRFVNASLRIYCTLRLCFE